MPARRPPTTHLRRLRSRVWTAGRVLVLTLALLATFGAFFMTAMRIANRAREVVVPDLKGLDTERAKRTLENAGLSMRIDGRRPDPTVAANHVIDQEPKAGSALRQERAVRVRVSDGSRDPLVPSVIGQLERTAEILLADHKIELASRSEISTDVYQTEVVIGQDPPATSHAKKLALLVNRGQATAGYVMPDIIGAMAARAIDVLRRRGFRVTVGAEVPYPGLPPGVVVRQTPQAGFRLASEDAIVLEVSR